MSISGMGSGLIDIPTIVDALVNAEIAPAQIQFQRQSNSIQTRLSALSQIKSAMDQLQTDMSRLSDLSQFYTMKTSVSDSDYLSVMASSAASPGLYQIEVKNLAQRQSLVSASFADAETSVGTGSITIDFGSYNAGKTTFTANPDKTSLTLDITAGNDSLSAIRDAINNSDSGVSATIIQDALGARISLTSSETGADLAMKISVSDDDGNSTDGTGLSALAYDPTSAVNSMTETIEAKNASIEVNGIPLSFSGNKIDNAIDGLTINLKKEEIGKIITVDVSQNTGQLKASVMEFVKAYNSGIGTLNQLTGYNKETEQGGLLQGDAGIRTLKMGLSSLIGTIVGDNNNPIRSLRDIGIKTDSNGLLQIDDAALSKAVDEHYDDIGALFSKTATLTDANIGVTSIGSTVKAGTYSINLSEYTPGTSVSGTIGGQSALSSDGNILTGTGDYSGLSIKVLGGTIGDRGSITIQDGLAAQFNNLLETYLADDGSLTQRTSTLDAQLTTLKSKAADLDVRAAKLRDRFTKQYTALDSLMSQLQGTSDFLTQQLANLPKIRLNNN